MLKISIFASVLLIATVAGVIDLYYNTHARTTPGYCLVGLTGAGFVVMVVLLVVAGISKKKTITDNPLEAGSDGNV